MVLASAFLHAVWSASIKGSANPLAFNMRQKVFFFVGMIGLLVVILVQAFFFADSTLMSMGIGVFGVLLFTGITAYDVQRLKDGRMPGVSSESATVHGALALYVDFLMLFLMMLRIFGGNR